MAINIQRGRDHGLAPYIYFRKFCGLDTDLPGGLAKKFSDLVNIDKEQRDRIISVYISTFDIDLFVGGISENPQPGSILGQTLTCLITDSFRRFRLGDRFWYKRNDSCTGFTCIRTVGFHKEKKARWPSLSEIFETGQEVIICDRIPSIDLGLWKKGG